MLEEYDWCTGGGAKTSIGVFDAAASMKRVGVVLWVSDICVVPFDEESRGTPARVWEGTQDGALCSSDGLAQRSEGGAELFREQFWLLPSREMSAFLDLVPVDELLEGLLSPAARSAVDLPGKDCHRNRHLRDLHRVERPAPSLRGVPVGPRRRSAGVREPIERDVVEDLISRERALNTLIGPLAELIVEKGQHTDRRICERIAQGLRPGIHHFGIAEPFPIEVLETSEGNFFCVGEGRGRRISIANKPQDAWGHDARHIDVDAQEALRCLHRHYLGY